jgi:hypothetical protein
VAGLFEHELLHKGERALIRRHGGGWVIGEPTRRVAVAEPVEEAVAAHPNGRSELSLASPMNPSSEVECPVTTIVIAPTS